MRAAELMGEPSNDDRKLLEFLGGKCWECFEAPVAEAAAAGCLLVSLG